MGLRPSAPNESRVAAMKPGELLWLAVEPVYNRISTDSPSAFLDGFSQVLPAQGHLFAAYCARSEVRDGGLHGFFLNSAGVMGPETARGLRFLEQPEIAEIVERAVALFGPDYPRGHEKREAALERLTRERNPFTAMDKELEKALESFEKRMDDFIRRNMDFFFG